MSKKKKLGVLAILLVLFIGPAFLMSGMLNPAAVQNEGVAIDPVKSYGLSANPAITTVEVTNPRTTNNLYGGTYETYYITANITNVGSVGDTTITLNDTTSILCGMSYDNATGAWTEHGTNSGYIVGTGTNTTGTGTDDFNVTLSITIDWTFPDTNNVYVYVNIANTTGTGTITGQSSAYDVDTDLVLTSNDFLVRSQDEQNSVIEVNTLTYSYEDSAAAVFPLAAQTDFWVTRSASTDPDSTYAAENWEADSYTEATGVATWTTDIRAKGGEHTETFTLFAVTQGGTASGTSVMDTSRTDTIDILDGPPRPDDDGGIIGDLAEADPMTVMIVGGGGIALVAAFYYLNYGGGSASATRGGRRRKSSKKKKPAKRKKSMKKKRRKRR